jgi:SNF2 family DNA or RNA helicase
MILFTPLQASIRAKGVAFCRIDGNMLSAEERQAEVRRFQAPTSTIPVFMLTSQVMLNG